MSKGVGAFRPVACLLYITFGLADAAIAVPLSFTLVCLLGTATQLLM